MGMTQLDLALCIDTDPDGNPRIRNTSSPPDPHSHLFKLNDFSTSLAFDLHQITVLEISNCEISQIPNTIQKLNLKQLILSHNKLKEVPSCLYSGLESLQLLDLSCNFLTSFEIAPACTNEIIKLNLTGNKIQNFPHWILTVSCPRLEEVCYSGNFLIKLNTTRELNIKRLDMRNSQLLDEDFQFLKNIKGLEALDISNDDSGRNENRFAEINGLFNRAKWKKMRVLKLNNLLLSVMPERLFDQTSLVELHLINCDLNWIPSGVRFLYNLRYLDVSKNYICGLKESLTSLEHLTVVRAAFNNISSVSEFCNNLEVLDLYSNWLEHPVCLERIGLVDLELNYLDTTQLEDRENYERKRDELRKKFDVARINGSTEMPKDPESGDDGLEKSESLDDDTVYDVYSMTDNQYYNDDDECWNDDPIPEKNPEVTASDDEWTAVEEVRKSKPNSTVEFDADEDWIFQDAEEK